MIHTKALLSFFGAALLAGLTLSSASAKEDVIITVEVDRALDEYYKVADFLTEMQASEAKAREVAGKIEAQGNALVEEFQELREQASSDILMETARKEAAEDAQKKFEEIQAKEQELRKFVSDTQRQFESVRRQQINLFYGEIADVVTEISRERKATLVIDISARAGDGRAPVIYTDGSYDITPLVIERINATKGQDAPAPAAPAAPAAN